PRPRERGQRRERPMSRSAHASRESANGQIVECHICPLPGVCKPRGTTRRDDHADHPRVMPSRATMASGPMRECSRRRSRSDEKSMRPCEPGFLANYLTYFRKTEFLILPMFLVDFYGAPAFPV